MEIESIKKVNLGPDDILLVEIPQHYDPIQMERLNIILREMLYPARHALYIKGEMEFKGVISIENYEKSKDLSSKSTKNASI